MRLDRLVSVLLAAAVAGCGSGSFPVPVASRTQEPTTAPTLSARVRPNMPSELIAEVTAGDLPLTTAEAVTAAMDAAVAADPRHGEFLDAGGWAWDGNTREMWPWCQRSYPVGPASADRHMTVEAGCAATGIALYLRYRQSGTDAYYAAFKAFIAYLKGRSDLNESGAVNRILHLIQQCRSHEGAWRMCPGQ